MQTIINISEIELSQLEQIKAFMKSLKIDFNIINNAKADYDPDFIEKISKSSSEYNSGDYIKVEQSQISTFLGL